MEERKVSTEIGKDLAKAKALLERGLTVAIPTETVYGLAANALDADAVLSVFEIKNRPHFDPLIVHSDAIEKIESFVTTIPEWARTLAAKFWPGPLTIVLQKRDIIPDLVTAGHDTVAVRIPNHELTLDLLSSLDFPLAAPSANPFGYISPTTPQHVFDQLGGKVPYILDGGECSIGLESTIITERAGKIVVLRLGGLSIEELEAEIGTITVINEFSSQAQSPGNLESHYAPRKPLILDGDVNAYDPQKTGVITFQKRYQHIPVEHQIDLSPNGDLREAAKALFAAMRYLDTQNVSAIIAESFPEVGLGRAINDRLRRAST